MMQFRTTALSDSAWTAPPDETLTMRLLITVQFSTVTGPTRQRAEPLCVLFIEPTLFVMTQFSIRPAVA